MDATDRRSLSVDAALALSTTAVIGFLIVLGFGGRRSADALAYSFAIGFGAVLLLRRCAPRVVVVFSVLALFAYYALDYPTIGVAVPVLASLYSAADMGEMAWAVGAAVVVTAATAWFRFRAGEPFDYLLGYETVTNAAMMAAAIALGVTVAGRRRLAAQRAEIARLTDEQRELVATDARRTERERISRELHDTVGHALTAISMQASVGTEAMGRDDDAATAALGHIRNTANDALHEVRALLRTVRAAEPPSTNTLADLPTLVERVRAAGLEVDVDAEGDAPGDIDPAVDRAAFRILQESLTNAVRHSGARRVAVVVAKRGDTLHLRVADDGTGAPGAAEGSGITGMRERARVLGGDLTAGGTMEGFVVEARLPVRLGDGL